MLQLVEAQAQEGRPRIAREQAEDRSAGYRGINNDLLSPRTPRLRVKSLLIPQLLLRFLGPASVHNVLLFSVFRALPSLFSGSPSCSILCVDSG